MSFWSLYSASCFSWPCRGFGLPTLKNSRFFANFKTPARPSADFGLVNLRKLVVFCDFQIARATLCGLENSRFFANFKTPARPSADFGLVNLRKLVVFCDFQIARATLCGLENSRFFAIFNSPARPSADFGLVGLRKLVVFCDFNSPARPSSDFGLVGLRKLVVFCDFQNARMTLCGLWAGQPSKTYGFLRFSNCPRDPLRSFTWLNRSHCGAARIFLRPYTLNHCRARICSRAR